MKMYFKQIIQFYLSVFLFSFLLESCSKNEIEELDPSKFGYDYYPVEIGKRWVYQTDSIVYSQKATIEIDSTSSFIREEVVDSFRDSENKLAYRLDVFFTRDTNLGWDLISSSFVSKDDTQLRKTENGLEYIKLVFPVRRNKSWSGNNRIAPKTELVINGERLEPFVVEWNYSYDYLDLAETVSNAFYDKVCKVTEVDDENALEKRYSEVKYAKGVGMIYKEQWILDTQIFDNSIPFIDKAQKGMILKQYLISHN